MGKKKRLIADHVREVEGGFIADISNNVYSHDERAFSTFEALVEAMWRRTHAAMGAPVGTRIRVIIEVEK